ncbi:hypothetical protein [Pseudomonas sp. 5Ae-yellow]|uniref:hypothetical protein n=1 Tax=Pseudomonas sp. 5Ae-yellow TaxID=2759848 RepID=UPI0015F69899|nr:hypothetical protein [Pseudomonas sp. 5Ae-yellow]MBA6421519.1 hypothetical protein [Pseudomonas sp. 5Ae-yellow]|tara:strand:- start:1567 stop:3261 length:1695 start_codon:yes stop_codon:yes gene_type:complete
MEASFSGAEKGSGNEATQEDTYTGEASFLCSSKTNGFAHITRICETLVTSKAFAFALDSRGRIYFEENSILKSELLSIDTTISGLGMSVNGHDRFLTTNPGDYNVYSLSVAFNLFLSDKKLFNAAFGFPAESARIFMRPIAIKMEGNEEHEMFLPYFRIYDGGTISLSLSPILGFENASVREVIFKDVNRSQRNISSILCEKTLLLACIECQVSQMPLQERIRQRKALKAAIKSALDSPEEIDFLNENISFYELVSNDKLSLTDVSRNLLAMVGRAAASGVLRTRINWIGMKHRDESVGAYWCAKPIIFIKSHTRQKNSSTENWESHKHLVNSVMNRVHVNGVAVCSSSSYSDMRAFEDFNSFYSEAVSLVLSSAQLESFIDQNHSYTFNNLVADVQVLNEASHFLQIYYSYTSLKLDNSKTAIDVAKIELEILRLEESLLSAHKYGEIAEYLNEIRRGNHFSTIMKLLHKKVETVRKALELDEKIQSESYMRRITIIFGIIASATLSPELMQPLANVYGITFSNDEIGKLVGIAASVVAVFSILTLSHYIFRAVTWITRRLKT